MKDIIWEPYGEYLTESNITRFMKNHKIKDHEELVKKSTSDTEWFWDAAFDPDAAWNRRWDGRWRLVLFDLPEAKSSARNKLRHYLQKRGFGYLQNSVWITPDQVDEERALLADGPVDVELLILLEARPCAGETDAEIVAGAWDFEKIKEAYSKHGGILASRPRRRLDTEVAAKAFYRWLSEEREAWMAAMWRDPLLPSELLPPGYNGRQAWQNRLAAMSEAGADANIQNTSIGRDNK